MAIRFGCELIIKQKLCTFCAAHYSKVGKLNQTKHCRDIVTAASREY